MKTLTFLLFIFFSVGSYAQMFTLELNITNIKNPKGKLHIAVYNSAEVFLKEKAGFRTYSTIVTKTTEKILIQNLPKGTYAISLYHDVNSDGICNRNFLGIPLEAYGFSKNFKPKISAPNFDDCMFNLTKSISDTIVLIQ